MNLKRMPKRYLGGAPEFVLDVFHDKNFVDGISVWCATHEPNGEIVDLMVFGTSESGGFSGWTDTTPSNLRGYRDMARRHRICWTELPEWIRKAVVEDMTV
jgi:hypothetical protein